MTQTVSERIDQLKTDVATSELPPTVKRIALDVLYKSADERTLKLAQTAPAELWEKYDLVRMIGGSNPRFVNTLLEPSLCLIEEAVYGHYLEKPVPDPVSIAA